MMDAITAATALKLIFGVTIACSAPAGTIVASLLPSGGDGTAVAFSITGSGIAADLVIRGSDLAVGPSGIAVAHCSSTSKVTVTASQK